MKCLLAFCFFPFLSFSQDFSQGLWLFNDASYFQLEPWEFADTPFRFDYNAGSYFNGAGASVQGNKLVLTNEAYNTDEQDEESVLYKNLTTATFEVIPIDAFHVEIKPLDVGAMVLLDECQKPLPAKDTKMLHDVGFFVQYAKELKAAKTAEKRKAIVKKWREKYGLNVEKASLTNSLFFAEPLREGNQFIDSLVFSGYEIQEDSVFFRDFSIHFNSQMVITSNWKTAIVNASTAVKSKAKKSVATDEIPLEVEMQEEVKSNDKNEIHVVPSYRDSITLGYTGQWSGQMGKTELQALNEAFAKFGPNKQHYTGDAESLRYLHLGYGQGKIQVYSGGKTFEYYLFQFDTPVLFEPFENELMNVYDKLRNVNSLSSVTISPFSFRK